MGSVRVAIVGVGNCASSLVQGVEYYKDADAATGVPGLMHVKFGEYHVSDVEFVAAFDVDAKKVGFDLSEAINASENNTIKIADVPPTGVTVQRGHTLDGLGKYYRQTIERVRRRAGRRRPGPQGRQGRRARLLPPGGLRGRPTSSTPSAPSTRASPSSTPCPSSSPPTPSGPRSSRPPASRSSATTSRARSARPSPTACMAKLFEDRGVALDRTYQLNVGGNMDFKNMLERERLESKKVSKTQAVTSNLTGALAGLDDSSNVHIGPSDYVAWLDDRKWAYVRLEGRAFGDVPLNLEYKLEVWDSPNSAGIIIDAIRAAKIAKDRGIGGALLSASSYLMKSPPVQREDTEGRAKLEAFIAGTEER